MIIKDVSFDLALPCKPFKHFFRATGYANADYTYAPRLRRMYDCLESYRGYPLYMRLHNILTLHGKGDDYILREGRDYGNPEWDQKRVDIAVGVDGEGNLTYNWELVDRVYDIIIGHGMRPIVEAVYMPQVICQSPEKFYLPKDFNLWEKIIAAYARHWIERYGIEEVRRWYFEVWNEPDNHQEWVDDPSSFFALYDYFESALHGVDPELKAGGPAVKQWEGGKSIFKAFLAHCDHGVNYKNGAFGTRLDFISVHCKGGHPTLVGPSIDYMFNTIREYAAMLKEFTKYGKTEFFNDESDIVWEGNMVVNHKIWLNFRNTHYAPGFTAKMIYTYSSVVEDELGLNLSIVDSDNCHLTWEKSFFSGNRSQFTPLGEIPCTDLVRKPIFNIFPLLGALGNERYIQKPDDPEYGLKYGVIATRNSGWGYAFLLWNFEDGLPDDVNERTIKLHLSNLDSPAIFDLLHFRIDENHSNAYAVWQKMGKPWPLSLEQVKELRKGDGLELCENPRNIQGKTFDMDFTLPMHGVSLLIMVRRGQAIPETAFVKGPELSVETGALGGKQIFIRWAYSARPDLAGYKVYRGEGDGPLELINRYQAAYNAYYTDLEVTEGRAYTYTVSAVYADGSESVKLPVNSIIV
ncbi:MAG: hypothetical protein LBD29_00555 [Treponema sp.]|jgi:xylan 1,4-beta-xylosidase|nr:hypothetical protein [Treponema sp.]